MKRGKSEDKVSLENEVLLTNCRGLYIILLIGTAQQCGSGKYTWRKIIELHKSIAGCPEDVKGASVHTVMRSTGLHTNLEC